MRHGKATLEDSLVQHTNRSHQWLQTEAGKIQTRNKEHSFSSCDNKLLETLCAQNFVIIDVIYFSSPESNVHSCSK